MAPSTPPAASLRTGFDKLRPNGCGAEGPVNPPRLAPLLLMLILVVALIYYLYY